MEELKVRNQEAQEVIEVKIQEKFTVSQEICKAMEAWSEETPPVYERVRVNISAMRKRFLDLPKAAFLDVAENLEGKSGRFGGIDIKELQKDRGTSSLSERFTALDKEWLGDTFIGRRILSSHDKENLIASQGMSLSSKSFKVEMINLY